MSDKKSSTSVYVELDALANWSSRMNTINQEALSLLESLDSTIKDIDNYWVGSSATGFRNASDKLISNAKRCHNNMKDLPRLLDQVAATMDSE